MLSRRDVLGGTVAVAVASTALPGVAAAWRRDLSGTWNNASGTPLQRTGAFHGLIPTEAETAAYQRNHNGVQAIPGDDVGQDGAEWFIPDEPLVRVGGVARTSIVVDPADGRLPYSGAGRQALFGSLRATGNFEGADARPAPERCLMGFGDPAAAPMLYMPQTTGDYEFVQTRAALAIRAESNHDVRIVPLGPGGGARAPVRAWQGVSQGRWEGDSLVIETTGFDPLEGLRSIPDQLYLSPKARVTERLTRTSVDEILYGFIVDDPSVFTRPWRGESVFRRSHGRVLDYECHEGNYALGNILRGARAQPPK